MRLRHSLILLGDRLHHLVDLVERYLLFPYLGYDLAAFRRFGSGS